MAVKARKRIKHVKEEDITNPTSGMCSTQRSTNTIVAERKEEAKREEKENQDKIQTDLPEGESNVKEAINSQSNPNESTGPGNDTADSGVGGKVVVEKTKEEKRRDEFSKQKLQEINKGAEEILSCLEPQVAHEYRIACAEYKCKDIGIYILAILNRLGKESDYYSPDFEPEWAKGTIGIHDELRCRYCDKLIENPTKVRQVFCSNLCAKYEREKNQTGLIFPDQTVEESTVEEKESEAYLAEQKRVGE
jgi:hypothetical protein